ncbi:MAG: DUF551 domain-containing protein [Methylovulum sp.]|nr:DUF551 domain-containing protein [Methylovulum sp.]
MGDCSLCAVKATPVWQEINCAPKDGTRILALENYKRINEDETKEEPPEMLVAWWSAKQGSWVCFGVYVLSFEPTHWRPLPELPDGTISWLK